MYDAQDFILRQEQQEEEVRECACCNHMFDYDEITLESDWLCKACFKISEDEL